MINIRRLFYLSKPYSISSTNSRCLHEDVRVRFAPSPTGKIHLGGLRTALYNYIFAKKHGGKFILRIEDTDQNRIVPGSLESIEDTLDWAQITPDESPRRGGNYGPYQQSDRLDLYQQRADQLIESGLAYRCFCSSERLKFLRDYQLRNREKPRYDGRCRHLSSSEFEEKMAETGGKYVIRFALQEGETSFEDIVFGRIVNNLIEAKEGDFVILKSDKFPTYHFANVVDDHAMKISHVLRGSEWISSTAKHIQLYQSFNWDIPTFAHFPLIRMIDGSKMSKRNNQTSVETWIKSGYRPRTLHNFLTTSGGGLPKEKQDSSEVWDLETIIESFNFSKMSCHNAMIDLERLSKLSRSDIKKGWAENPDELIREFKSLMNLNSHMTDLHDDQLREVIDVFIQDRLVTLNDLLDEQKLYVWKVPKLSWSREEYRNQGWDLKKLVGDLIMIVDQCNDLANKEILTRELKLLADKHKVEYNKLMMFVRRALTNSETGQPVYEIFTHLGKSRLLNYLNEALKYVEVA